MMNTRFFVAAFLLVASLGSVTHAQSPNDPQAQVPVLRYTSSLASYRPILGLNVGSWRDANDQVGRIGGWRVYQREALGAATPPSAPVR
jgi:hypothetical protein